jgi:hypothetical protein
VTGESLQVPLNRAKFQKYRNMNAVIAGMGLFMVLLACFSGAYMLQSTFTDPKIRGFMISGVVMSAWLIIFIGLATLPAWQLAQCQTRVLSQNAPALIVDQDGIVDNASNYVLGRITWPEVESVIATSRYAPNIQQTFPGIAIVLKNKDMLLRKKPKILAMWMQMDDEIKQKRQVFIPQARLDVPVEELVAQINNFHQQLRSGSI